VQFGDGAQVLPLLEEDVALFLWQAEDLGREFFEHLWVVFCSVEM